MLVLASQRLRLAALEVRERFARHDRGVGKASKDAGRARHGAHYSVLSVGSARRRTGSASTTLRTWEVLRPDTLTA